MILNIESDTNAREWADLSSSRGGNKPRCSELNTAPGQSGCECWRWVGTLEMDILQPWNLEGKQGRLYLMFKKTIVKESHAFFYSIWRKWS